MSDMSVFGNQIFGAVAQSMADRLNPMNNAMAAMIGTTVVTQQASALSTIDEQIQAIEKRAADPVRPLTDREIRTIAQLEKLQAKLTA